MAFLLDRERAHWADCAAQRKDGIEDSVDADIMAQTVYTATLTGRLSYADGQSALKRIGVESNRPLGPIPESSRAGLPSRGRWRVYGGIVSRPAR